MRGSKGVGLVLRGTRRARLQAVLVARTGGRIGAQGEPRALIASRTNTLLSLPMFYAMVSANLVA